MRISPTKFISLLFLVLSALYLYSAYNIQVFAFDENAPFNARTFPIYLGYAGIFLSLLKIILPEKTTVIVDHGGGFYTVYSHVTNIQINVDSQVRNGDVIAYMGDSGSINGTKLHFEIWGKGQKLDPEKWLVKK